MVVVVGTVACEGGGEGGHCMDQELEVPYKALESTSVASRQGEHTISMYQGTIHQFNVQLT